MVRFPVEKTDFYLIFIGGLSAILTASFQAYQTILSFRFFGGLLLGLFGIVLFFLLGKYCESTSRRLILLGSFYLIIAYLAWPNRTFWLDWHDQGYYFRMLSEMANGFLTAENFRYGIGYPILAIPFYPLIGEDALFIPNLIAFVGTIYLSFNIFRSLSDDLTAKLATLLLIFGTTFTYHHIIWWSHGIVIFCFLLTANISLKKKIDNKALLLVGFVVGYSFFTRYVEVIIFLPLIVFIIWRKKLKALALIAIGAAPMIFATFFAHWIVFGNPLMTPYGVEFGQAQYFLIENIPQNIFFTFFYYPANMALGDPAVGILKFPVLIWAFFFIFAPLGMYRALKNQSEKLQKGFIIAAVFSIILCVFYSSAYFQFHSGSFGPYPADFRYILPSFPFLAFFSTIGLLSYIRLKDKNKKS